jgi:4-amino-4-deoxy-L-arabinose transferase-like glycosyltransferase
MNRLPAWSLLVLAIVLAFDVWLRAHTFGPTLRDRWGLDFWPVTDIESEPIDCDEAVYTYVGRRLLRGDVLYLDLTEPKPPGGYWLYTLGVALGGADELMVRLLPIPMVLATIALLWWIAGRLAGPFAACSAALLYAVASTDPYLFGNGSNLEHVMNLGAVAGLTCMLAAWPRTDGGRRWLFLSGLALGFACLFKQVCALHGLVFGMSLLMRRVGERPLLARLGDVLALGMGLATPPCLAGGVLLIQGAGAAAYDDVVRYAAAMVRDIPDDPHAPPLAIRWITGNSDPGGELPFPFGQTDYLVWWGLGTWPLWLLGVPALLRLVPCEARRRLVAAWTLSAWVQVMMPKLFWPHYYLLPIPGLSIALAIWLADAGRLAARGPRRLGARFALVVLLLGISATFAIQTRDYLLVKPQQLTIRYKGGRQWVALRQMGHDLKRRTEGWNDPRLFVWGWQSPLFVYSGLDGVSRHFFADNLIKTFAGTDHPLIRPRVERIMSDLKASPPDLIYAGDIPFEALRAWLVQEYAPVSRLPDDRGLWVKRSRFAEFLARERTSDLNR